MEQDLPCCPHQVLLCLRALLPQDKIEENYATFAEFRKHVNKSVKDSVDATTENNLWAKREFSTKQLHQIRNYLHLKRVQPELKSRILEYFEYLFTSSQSLNSMRMFDNLPASLGAQLKLSVGCRR